MYTLQNKNLALSVAAKGAELKSLKRLRDNFEFIWQADPTVWDRSAPNLFPIVGEVKDNKISVDSQPYELKRHGFVRDAEFVLNKKEDNFLELKLSANENTLALFPYKFELLIGYTLEENGLKIAYTVKNTDDKTIYFSIGAHPGFNLPTGRLEDYNIEFEHPETAERHLLKNNLFSGETEPVLNNSNTLPLTTALFDKDAIVFKHLKSQKLALKSRDGDYNLTMEYPGFPYLGIWTKPNCQQYLCLEPWCGLADNAAFCGDFKEKEGVERLEVGGVWERKIGVFL